MKMKILVSTFCFASWFCSLSCLSREKKGEVYEERKEKSKEKEKEKE